MNIHQNARLTPLGRAAMISRIETEGWSVARAAEAFGVSRQTVDQVQALRRQRMTGPAIARSLGLARSTVGLILRRLGLGKLSALEPRPPIVRYERAAPGEMIHLDIKKLSRFTVEGHRVTGDRRLGRSKLFAKALQAAGARHVRTRPYTPRTNGKAERFIQTSLREWAYGRPYACSQDRSNAIKPWTDAYNLTRPHSGIGGLTPWQQVNNLLGNDT